MTRDEYRVELVKRGHGNVKTMALLLAIDCMERRQNAFDEIVAIGGGTYTAASFDTAAANILKSTLTNIQNDENGNAPMSPSQPDRER